MDERLVLLQRQARLVREQGVIPSGSVRSPYAPLRIMVLQTIQSGITARRGSALKGASEGDGLGSHSSE
jgi:hypothetical protein